MRTNWFLFGIGVVVAALVSGPALAQSPCISNCSITTSVGPFAVAGAEFSESFPFGCIPGTPLCAAGRYLAVSLQWQGTATAPGGSAVFDASSGSYVAMEDGTHRITFGVTVYLGAQAGRYDLLFNVGLNFPPSTPSQFQFFWPPNGGVDVCQFLTVTPTSGSGQAAPPNTAFANPLVAKVTDSADNPVPGVLVTFTGPGSGAGIVVAMAASNSAGVVSATVEANGTAGGLYTLSR